MHVNTERGGGQNMVSVARKIDHDETKRGSTGVEKGARGIERQSV